MAKRKSDDDPIEFPDFDEELSKAIEEEADKLEVMERVSTEGTATRTSQAIEQANSSEADKSFQAKVATEHARFLIVEEGVDVVTVARRLGVDPAVLQERAEREGWIAERDRIAAINARIEDNTDTVAQNLALRDNFRRKLLMANQRLDLIDRAVHRRTLDAVGQTTPVTFTDMDGNEQTLRVPTAREGVFEALLVLNKHLVEQANLLSNYIEPQAEASAKRLRRSRLNAARNKLLAAKAGDDE
jgi:hypothetical protein